VFRPDNSVQLLEVGASIPWHACAVGKAIVAFLPAERRGELLRGELPILTGHTVSSPAALVDELAKVERAGYAVEDQEAIIGEGAIASPVFDGRGGVAGAIGVSGPVERLLPTGPEPSILASVREAARALSRDLGAGRYPARRGP